MFLSASHHLVRSLFKIMMHKCQCFPSTAESQEVFSLGCRSQWNDCTHHECGFSATTHQLLSIFCADQAQLLTLFPDLTDSNLLSVSQAAGTWRASLVSPTLTRVVLECWNDFYAQNADKRSPMEPQI